MNNEKDNVGYLLRHVLYHFRSIEERLSWSKALHHFRHQDKHLINQAVRKVQSAINDVIGIIKVPQLTDAIRKEVNKPDLLYYMTLTEQLYDLREEDLVEITEMIDQYLHRKYLSEHSAALN